MSTVAHGRWGPGSLRWLAVFAVVMLGCNEVANAYGTTASGWTLAVAALVAVVVGMTVVVRRRRGPVAVARWAAVHGWSYDLTASAVPLAGRDVLRKVLDGVTVTSYTTMASPDMVSENGTGPTHVVTANVPADLPTLLVLPQALMRRSGAAPLAPDIQFESARFNERWRVHCADATFAHAFCHPLVMERLMRPDSLDVSILVEGRDVIVHAPGPTVLEAIESRAELVADLVRLLPPYLITRHPARKRRGRS